MYNMEDIILIELRQALQEIIKFGVPPSQTMSRIIFDYANYHAIMVLMSGLLFLLFGFLSYKFWIKFKRIPNISQVKWDFEKKSYFYFLTINIIVGLFMLLLVVANTTNTINPLHGLSLAYNSTLTEEETNKEIINNLNTNLESDDLHRTFSNWIKSSEGAIPAPILVEINNRVNFHTAKAFKSFALLIFFVCLSRNRWQKMIKNAKDIKLGFKDHKWGIVDFINFGVGNLAIAISLLLMIIVEANIQGAFAPLTAFLVGFL